MGGAHRWMHGPWRGNPKRSRSLTGAGIGKQSAAPASQRSRTDCTRLWQTLLGREKRTPGLTKNIPDICGELWGLERLNARAGPNVSPSSRTKAPNSKLQDPKKIQAPSSKTARVRAGLMIGISLVLGCWNLE